MNPTINYVLTFVFDAVCNDVLLIFKTHGPDSVRGKWGGLGGRIEKGETARQAAQRETLEECGLNIQADFWQYIGIFKGDGEDGQSPWLVEVFATWIPSEDFNSYFSPTKERVSDFTYDLGLTPSQIASNVSWLIPLAIEIRGQEGFAVRHYSRAKEHESLFDQERIVESLA